MAQLQLVRAAIMHFDMQSSTFGRGQSGWDVPGLRFAPYQTVPGQSGEAAMRDVTLDEVRDHPAEFIAAAERGITIRVFRDGQVIAEIVPPRVSYLTTKKLREPLTLPGVCLADEILRDREAAA
jgi:antitoxin (DNA-binding transcriptional repressor) of toxin-antitoxin stability system